MESGNGTKNIKVGIPNLKLAGRTTSDYDASGEIFMQGGVKLSVA